MFKVLYFSTQWCGPCKTMAPTINEAQKFLTIEKVDAELSPDLVQQFGIRSVPTFIFMKEGREVGRKNGAMSMTELQNLKTIYG